MPSKTQSPEPTKTKAPRVLVVDDDPEIRSILEERLSLEGYEVESRGSGEEGLIAYLGRAGTERAHDVLILDIKLEGVSGSELLKVIRRQDEAPTILMISGFGDLHLAVQCLREGADDYLSKPIKTWDLRARVETARGRRRSILSRLRKRKDRECEGLPWGALFLPQVPPELEGEIPPDPSTEKRIPPSGNGEAPRNSGPEPTLRPATTRERERVKRKGEAPSGARPHGPGEGRARKTGKRERSSGESDPASEGSRVEGAGGSDGPVLRPGEGRFPPSPPLEALCRSTSAWEEVHRPFRRHSGSLAEFLARLAAYFQPQLDLSPSELEALRLAAAVHGFGRKKKADCGGEGDRTTDAPPPLAPGQEEERLAVPAGLCRALADSLDSAGEREIPSLAADLLSSCLSFRNGAPPPSSRGILRALPLLELADSWRHFREEGWEPYPDLPPRLRARFDGRMGDLPLEDCLEALTRLDQGEF